MTNQIQQLESRLFFSASTVTAATLATDYATIQADAATLKVETKTLFGNDKIDTALIAAAFKALPKGHQTLLKTLELDSGKGGSILSKDISSLLNASTALAKKSAAIGTTLLIKATPGSLAAAQKDIAQLDTITALPLSNLQTLLTSSKLENDRALIEAAFPQDSAIIDAVFAEATSAAAGKSAILTEATKYQADIATLAADLTSVRGAVGTFPNLLGTFTGTATKVGGKKSGESADITLAFVSEDAVTGKVTGTATDQSTGGIDTVAGTVTLNGKIVLVIKTGGKGIITGQVIGTSIAGKFKIGGIGGIFSVSEAMV